MRAWLAVRRRNSISFGAVALALVCLIGGCSSPPFSTAQCNAHNAPIPAKRLDWVLGRKNQLPDVSCEVGDGIAAGSWQWSEDSSRACVYVVVGGNAKREWSLGQFQARRDARQPIPLNEGEFVWGFAEHGGSMDPYSMGSSHPICKLEHVGD